MTTILMGAIVIAKTSDTGIIGLLSNSSAGILVIMGAFLKLSSF
jgi:hypothetical protein